MASRVGRSHPPPFGRIPWCFFIRTHGIGLHSFCWTHNTIKMTDDTSFKDKFRQIPPPLVEEVQSHLREVLESGAIWPSQSAWCNAIVLVRKKDRGLWFCIDFCCLNVCMKKDSYPLLRTQEVLESLVGARHFFMPRPQIGVLANKDGGGIKTIYHLHSRQFGVFQVWPHALWVVQCTSHVSEIDAKLSWQVEPHLLPYLLRWHNHILVDGGGTPPQIVHGLWQIQGV